MADELNYKVAAEGFGSYLDGILPPDVAMAAGAFSASMQQIRNILAVDFEKFAQVMYSTEITNAGLNLINGSDVPVNVNEANLGYAITSLGSGPYGTYTASDFFGCMSGLPYMWNDIQSGISTLQTTKLRNIYHELFLATTWERGYVTITQSTYPVMQQPYIPPTYDPLPPYGILDPGQPRIDDWYYTLSISLAARGGGYGRGTAPGPTLIFSPNSGGASAICSIGADNSSAQSLGGGTFGRITALNFNPGSPVYYATTSVNSYSAPSAPTPPVVTVTTPSPPTSTLPVQSNGQRSTGGTNTGGVTTSTTGGYVVNETGWPAMNSIVQAYVAQADVEVANIRTTQPYKSNQLNVVYNAAGSQLKIEQRARFSGIAPVAIPRDDWLNMYPTALSVFVDSIPTLSQDTRPHMYVQTLEAISNINTVGGQSVVGMMRQERNAARLQELGIELDNNIPGEYSPELLKVLMSNGTVPTAVEGLDVTGINGNNNEPKTIYTTPSSLLRYRPDGVPIPTTSLSDIISPKPKGFYDPNDTTFKAVQNTTKPGQFSVIQPIINLQNNTVNNQNLLGPSNNGTGPAVPKLGVFGVPSAPGGLNNASPLTGTIVSPNSVNPKPNQVPLNLQTGVTNLGGTPPAVRSLLNAPRVVVQLPGASLGPNGELISPSGEIITPEIAASLGIDPANYGINVAEINNVLPGQPQNIPQNNDSTQQTEPIAVVVVGPQLPIGVGVPIDTGKPIVPGSLAGSTAENLLPPNLDASFMASTLTPFTLDVQEAIDEVIKCNCDCWVD